MTPPVTSPVIPPAIPTLAPTVRPGARRLHRSISRSPVQRARLAMGTRLAMGICLYLATVVAGAVNGHAHPPPAPGADDVGGGRLEAMVDNRPVSLPLLATAVDADIQGDLATVTVTQRFANPLAQPVHARYLFPLNRQAAVYAMTLTAGEERIVATIQKKAEAEAQFEAAVQGGKSAALLTQHRPNVFTQQVGNLMPGIPIEVTLRYVHPLPKVDGHYQWVVPLVVGPRYHPAVGGVLHEGLGVPAPAIPHATAAPPGGLDDHGAEAMHRETHDASPPPEQAPGRWVLQEVVPHPPVVGLTSDEPVDLQRVRLTATLDAGLAIADLESPSHALDVEAIDDRRRRITLAAGAVADDRDFILRYRLSGDTPQVGAVSQWDPARAGGGFFSLLVEPPAAPGPEEIQPREIVLVVDGSGSMAGRPMAASKALGKALLERLRPTDHFRIVRFSDSASEFSPVPLPATPVNIRRGLGYLAGLQGQGGTEMTAGLRQALDVPYPADTLRLVLMLTDGYIGNEQDILALTQAHLGRARLFAFGVGQGVNRYLLAELARVGRGFHRVMTLDERDEAVVVELVERLQSPVLTDIDIDWGTLTPLDVTPDPLPDLFAGQSLRIVGRYAQPGTYPIVLKGQVGLRQAQLRASITLVGPPDGSPDGSHGAGESDSPGAGGDAVALTWARARIAHHQHQLATPYTRHTADTDAAAIEAAVTQLGLDFALVTPWTSFVAVTERVYNPHPGETTWRSVPLSQVDGVEASAYGLPPGAQPTHIALAPGGAGTSFTGHGAPEPAAWLALLLLLVTTAWWWQRGGMVAQRPMDR